MYKFAVLNRVYNKKLQRWIQRIAFDAETNAASSRGSADTQTDFATQYLLRSLSGGEGN